MNYALIGKYWLRFFPKELFTCTCGDYPIKMKRYILFACMHYKKS